MNNADPKILAVRVHPKDHSCCLFLQDISLPACCYLLGLIRQNSVILANNNPPVFDQDLIIIIVINSMVFPELIVSLKQIFWVYSWLETTSVSWSKPY
jgi:hypothetical protein